MGAGGAACAAAGLRSAWQAAPGNEFRILLPDGSVAPPGTPMGKVRKNVLRDPYWAGRDRKIA